MNEPPALPDPVRDIFRAGVPHSDALGIEFLGWGGTETSRTLRYRLPWNEALVGNPETGALFGGPVFTVIDYALGTVCSHPFAGKRIIATIDLRVDYTRPSQKGRVMCTVCAGASSAVSARRLFSSVGKSRAKASGAT